MHRPEVFVVSAVRTAIGTFGGTLKDTPPAQLATLVTQAALARANCDAQRVEHVVFGHVIPTTPKDAYISRVAALQAGIPKEAPAFTVNRLCGSGLQAIVSAAQGLMLGDSRIAIAGGAECKSQSGYLVPSARWGARMGDVKMLDYMLGALQDPLHGIHMGITAENIAKQHGITRQDQDALALQSQQRAARAIAEGRFAGQIVPVTVVQAGPCVVTAVRTPGTDGYSAVQLGFGEIDPRKVTKPVSGVFQKAGLTPRRYLAELRTDDASEYTLGQEVTAEVFASGQHVDVTGKSKGKGTAGVMKRHGFKGLGAGHGTQRKHRSPGSIGGCATPGRVFKGLRMAGRMGHVTATTTGLVVHKVDAERGLLLIKGAVPGPKGGLLLVRSASKSKGA